MKTKFTLSTLIIFSGIFFYGCEMGNEKNMNLGAPTNLTCEFVQDPIGLDQGQPRFSWIVNDKSRGARQSAYQILVSSSLDNLNKDDADIWNSEKVASDQSHLVGYDGIPLKSRMRYFWKVKSWDMDDKDSGYSHPAFFEMALLESGDWKAEWIGKNETGSPPRSIMLRKEFEVNGNIDRARIYVTGLGSYLIYLNGQKVGNDLLTPGWTDYPEKVQYQVYDVTDLLNAGQNVIGAILGNMWWSGGLGWSGSNVYSHGPLRLLAQLEISTSEGRQDIISDNTWKLRHSPYIENTLYHGVTYDARQTPVGWSDPGFNDSSWENAVIIDSSDAKLVAQQGPPIQITEQRVPEKITEVKPGIYVFDFGVNMVGFTRLNVIGASGDSISMRFAELLHDDGTVAQENLRSARATDTYICNGNGTEVFQPWFTYHGFRYVQVEGLENKPDESTLTGLVFHSTADPTGEFACSEQLLNDIYTNIRRGQIGNMMSVPTDCPQRDERLGWMGDAQIFAPTACYNMNMARFFEKWEGDIMDCQDPSGFVNDVNPAIVVTGPSKPAWGDAVVIIPWTVYKYYGDKRIIEKNYAGMKAWVDYMDSLSENYIYTWHNKENNWFGYGDWIAVETSPAKPISDEYFFYSTSLLSKIADIIGNPDDAGKYADLAANIKKAFNGKYFNSVTNNYEGATQTANLLPLAFGLAPEEVRTEVAKNIADNVRARDNHPTTGFLGTAYLLPILSDFGYHDLAYNVATQTTYPSWGYMVKKGATSMWELWNSDSEPPEGMNSRNHFALGSVGAWYYGYLSGIRPSEDEPGFKKSIIAPMPTDSLQWARAKINTSYGLLESSWQMNDGKFKLEVTVPPNTSAEIYFPVSKGHNIQESGKIIYQDNSIKGDKGLFKLIDTSEEKIAIQVGAGKYSFTVE